jgi:hypothetical protein
MGDANTAAFEGLATNVTGLNLDLQSLQTGADLILAEHLDLQASQDEAVAGLDEKLDSIAGTAGDTLAAVQDPQAYVSHWVAPLSKVGDKQATYLQVYNPGVEDVTFSLIFHDTQALTAAYPSYWRVPIGSGWMFPDDVDLTEYPDFEATVEAGTSVEFAFTSLAFDKDLRGWVELDATGPVLPAGEIIAFRSSSMGDGIADQSLNMTWYPLAN